MSRLPLQNRRHRIINTLLQPPILNPQHPPRPRIIKPIHILREIIHRPLPTRQLTHKLRMFPSNDIRKPLIRKMPSHNIEPLPARLGPRHSPHVRQGNIADVDPREHGRRGLEPRAHPAEDQVADALVGGVDRVEVGQLALDGAEGVCVADRGEVEVGSLFGDEGPGGLFRQFLCV